GNARFSGDRARNEGLASSRRADEQDAPRHLSAEPSKSFGLAQEIDDLLKVLLRRREPGHVVEVNTDVLFYFEAARARLQDSRERPARRRHPLDSPRQPYPSADDERPRQKAYQELENEWLLLALHLNVDFQ